jgi:hypothetical protein
VRSLSPTHTRTLAPDRAWLVVLAALGVLSSIAVCLRFGALGDYPFDGGPSVDALAGGNVQQAAARVGGMGSFSVIFRAPLVALARAGGLGDLGAYQAGAIACLIVMAMVAVVMAVRTTAVGRSRVAVALVVLLAVANPASVAAVKFGHPEEALTAALCVLAVVLARRDQSVAAAAALGLAIATKQWAVVAIVPALLAAPGRSRLLLLVLAGAVAASLTIPLMLTDPAQFHAVSRSIASAGYSVTRSTWWFFASTPDPVEIRHLAGGPSTFTIYRSPVWLEGLAHPLIAGLGIPLGLLVLWRRGSQCRDAALPLLALLFLLRCTLDPIDNTYYHLPLLLALLAWETTATDRTVPAVTLLAMLGHWVMFDLVEPAVSPPAASRLYAILTLLLFAYLVRALGLFPPVPRALRYGVWSPLRLRSQYRMK